MVVQEPEGLSQGEVESPLRADQQHRTHPFTSLGRQSSIYSLTLDEFQNTLCESGKNFGSMNMDEFLTSIWTAEENQAVNSSARNTNDAAPLNNAHAHHLVTQPPGERTIAKQPSLPRQGSLTLPPPLCRKTVDEVWSEIHRGQQAQQQNDNNNGGGNNNNNVQNPDPTPRQPTFGEMTLEDFLVKAGVVRETVPPHYPPHPQQHPHHHYAMYQSNNPAMGPAFVNRPVMGMGAAAGGPAYQPMPQRGESSVYSGNGKRNGGYAPPPPHAVCYGGRAANGAYGPGQAMAMAAPVSPVSPDGMCGGQVDNTASQYGLDMGGLRGRKRFVDGPVEKVVERRQRRMIKNRESAARSRARKQAYTVELEAELNQLKEENTQLKQALAELERKRKQQYFDELRTRVQTKAQKTREKLRFLRRSFSCPP